MTGETKGGIVDGLIQRSITTRRGRQAGSRVVTRAFVVVAVVALVASACSSSTPPAKSSSSTTPTTSGTTASTTAGTPSPGVTATSVTVGQVDDLTAPLPGLFKGAEDGTQAYFDYINSQGGVNGRMIKLDAQDSAYNDGTVANATSAQIKSDFALVGGFSLRRRGREAARRRRPACPTSPIRSTPTSANLPISYSPAPNNDSDYPLTIFKVLKEKFPKQIKHVGILWANATPSTATAEKSFERAAQSQGFKIVYDSSFTPSQTTFLPDVLTMKTNGVQMFFTTQMPDNVRVHRGRGVAAAELLARSSSRATPTRPT